MTRSTTLCRLFASRFATVCHCDRRRRVPSSAQHSLSSWSFPHPPPPPLEEEVSRQGLPLLRQVVQHAERPFLSEWPSSAIASQSADDDDSNNDTDDTTNNDTRILTYQHVISKAIRVSQFIQQKQQQYGSSSLFVAHSTIPGSDYIACQWGAFAAGKASVPLAISQKTPELQHVLQDSNPIVILVSSKSPNYANVLEAAQELNMSDRIVHVEELVPQAESSHDLLEAQLLLETATPSPSLDQPALLLYTSGTTGKPKGVLHTHRGLYHQVTDLTTAWEWQPHDVALHVLPLHHVHGVVNILSCAAYTGAQLQFQPFDPYQLWNQWANQPPLHHPDLGQVPDNLFTGETSDLTSAATMSDPLATQLFRLPRPTVFMAVPTIYAKLLEAARQLPPELIQQAVERTLYPMRLQVSGSAALPATILQEWQQLTGHTLLERYGMTEFAMALSNPYNEIVAPRRPGYVGVPLPSVQVRLVDPTTGDVVLDGNDTSTIEEPISGALQVKGPILFREYWNRPDATAEAFCEGGYFNTGDVAEYNPEWDSYRILGRASVDILKVGGHKLSALEIERELLEHPDIAEVVIVGVDDATWGQRVGMIARKSKGSNEDKELSLEQVQEWCQDRLAKYKTPTLLLWMDEIPKNAMGKVNKKELVRLFDGVK